MQDLTTSRANYETLGFQVLEGGNFPGGASNAIINFEDHFYLELITAPGKRIIALPLFFIEYVPAPNRFPPNEPAKPSGKSLQSNGVVGVRAVWFGEHDLIGALAAMPEQGLGAPQRSVGFAHFWV